MKFSAVFIILVGYSSFACGQGLIQGENIPDYKDQDTNALLSWEPPAGFEKAYPYALLGFDDENVPIFLVEYGKWDVRKAIEDGQENELKLYVLQMLKRTADGIQIRSTPEDPVTQLNVIDDLDGFGSRQATHPRAVAFALWFARNVEQVWGGGRLKIGFVLNSNFLFQAVFRLMQPLLGPDVSKVEIFGNNRETWLPALVRAFPKTEIPKYYGGEKGHKPVAVYG